MTEPHLCYVSGNVAWFTTAAAQWGDDWDDAPYEHNAGEPYDWRPYMADHGVEPYELIQVVFFDAGMEQPCDQFGNSPYSVERINAGIVPWLVTDRWSRHQPTSIFAGATIPEFKAAIRSVGGRVFVEEPEPSAVPA